MRQMTDYHCPGVDASSVLHFRRRFDATIREFKCFFLCGLLLIYAALGRIWQVGLPAGSWGRVNNIMKVLFCLSWGDQPLLSLLNYWSGSVVTVASQEEGSRLPE